MNQVALDAGALIALERRDKRMIGLLRALASKNQRAHTTAGVLAQAWRGSKRQHALHQLVKSDALQVHPLDKRAALQIGMLLSQTGTSDVVVAHVVLLAKSMGAVVVSSDSEDLKRLDSALTIHTI